MKRVTGSRVVKAFKATGFKPIQGVFVMENETGCYACALTALAAHEKNAKRPEFDDYNEDDFGSAAINRLELSSRYTLGFMDAWDDERRWYVTRDRESYDDGYSDGVKARRAVVKAGLAEFEV